MQTIGLALRSSEDEGSALPSALPQLEQAKALIRRGQLTMLAGSPGGGKSVLAGYIALNSGYGEYGEDPLPVLYFSADTDKKTFGTRLAANLTKFTVQEAEALLDEKHAGLWQMLEDGTRNVWFHWNRTPDLDDIELEIMAYATVMGEYPHLIVVDNLKNVYIDEEGADHVRYDRVLDFLHEIAGKTNAAILVLHHVTGGYESGDIPIPLPGILGKVTKPFSLILTLHRAYEGVLGICVVKNRTGRADPSGGYVIHVPYDLSRMQFNHVPLKELQREEDHDWHSGIVRY